SQIALLQTFARQAVIAIENTRLFEAEQQRSRELSESLEQQTATSEVLRIVSTSPGELQPVFEAMLANAVRLCEASYGALWLREPNDIVGVIAIYRTNDPPFTEKQIELLTNFAAQAVIAIENARLLNELRQSLEQQTATSEVLRVISVSRTNIRPVLDAVGEN